MKAAEALKVLKLLAEGYDPRTGEVLPDESCCQYPNVIRALSRAVQALEAEVRSDAALGPFDRGCSSTESSVFSMLEAIGYHGTRLTFAERILAEDFRGSANDWEWLGHGIYFWQDAPGYSRNGS